MSPTSASLGLALVSLVLLAACGGGSTDPVVEIDPLNSHEEKLVGSYTLVDFKLYAVGDGIYRPGHFDTWTGTLELDADRTGTLSLCLTEQPGGAEELCERRVTWRADVGLLQLDAADGAESNGIAEWEFPAAGVFRTRFFQPTNRPDCQPYLIREGYESFDWAFDTQR